MTPYEKALHWDYIYFKLEDALKYASAQDFLNTFDYVSLALEELRKIGKEQEK